MNTDLFLPDSGAPMKDKYSAAWELIKAKYDKNQKAHSFCWLSYRAFEGGVSFQDWEKHILPNYFADAGPRWDASMNAVCGFLYAKQANWEKAAFYLEKSVQSGNSITSLKAAAVLTYLRWLTNGDFEQIGLLATSMWKASIAEVDLSANPSWISDGGYDAAPLHIILKLLSNEGVTNRPMLSRWWVDHLISNDRGKPWLQCCNQILREGFSKNTDITIVCVLKSGGEYHSEHVEMLRQACLSFMPRHQFVCLSDIDIPNCKVVKMQKGWKGWWSKIELFDHFKSGTTLYLDLDTVLTSDCCGIIQSCQGRSFYALRDFFFGAKNPEAIQSSVMIWNKDFSFISEQFDFEKHSKTHHGDQSFIQQCLKERGVKVGFIQDFSREVVSFKAEVAKAGLQKSHKMIVFHGEPRPWNQQVVTYPNRRMPMSLRQGLVVPSGDKCALGIILREVEDVDVILPYCARLRTVVQAGGNIGIWPIKFSASFQRVITFEPDPANFTALSVNISEHPNIIAHNFALGSEEGTCGIEKNPMNIGAHAVDLSGRGVPVSTVDSLNLSDCDLIQLDIEGFEHQAVLGAKQTIERCRPIVILEMKGLSNKFGFNSSDTTDLLISWGYRIAARVKNDVIFTPTAQGIAEKK